MNNETIILLNEEDAGQGYFQFGTSLERHYKRLCKRIGGQQNLVESRLSKSTEGKTVWWQCKVPLRYWSDSAFSLRSPRIQRELSEKQREAFTRLRATQNTPKN